jgi:hypothetical protein
LNHELNIIIGELKRADSAANFSARITNGYSNVRLKAKRRVVVILESANQIGAPRKWRCTLFDLRAAGNADSVERQMDSPLWRRGLLPPRRDSAATCLLLHTQ